MIIDCKNCLKKFTVKDSDIPTKGRTVQCGNCSTQWTQMPILPSFTTDNLDVRKDFSEISSSVILISGNIFFNFFHLTSLI